ncbi:MAG: hypothetical protein ABF747_02395 [Bifidobacterium sp.]|uniref:Uncharacterized protein n=1 Tax=Bifidobacterium fermentum TaxID=3059035 RepID=A0AB39URW3_9BIFI
MTQEYTPTDSEIRAQYANDPDSEGVVDERRGAVFDRWLVAHDAQIRADAWDEGRQSTGAVLNNHSNPYRKEQK